LVDRTIQPHSVPLGTQSAGINIASLRDAGNGEMLFLPIFCP